MRSNRKARLADFSAVAKVVQSSIPAGAQQPVEQRRRLVAEFCKLVARHAHGQEIKPAPQLTSTDVAALHELAPRLRQTLDRLLAGDSEKQVAAKLGLSRHTVHVYVKSLHKKLGVSSRSELLSRCFKKV